MAGGLDIFPPIYGPSGQHSHLGPTRSDHALPHHLRITGGARQLTLAMEAAFMQLSCPMKVRHHTLF